MLRSSSFMPIARDISRMAAYERCCARGISSCISSSLISLISSGILMTVSAVMSKTN